MRRFFSSGILREESHRGRRFFSVDVFHEAPARPSNSAGARAWGLVAFPVTLFLIGAIPAVLGVLLDSAVASSFTLRGWVLSTAGPAGLLAFSALAACAAALLVRWFHWYGLAVAASDALVLIDPTDSH